MKYCHYVGGGKKDDLHFAYMVTGTYLMDDLPGTAFLSSFGQVTSTDGCFLLLCVLVTAVEE